MKAYAPRGAVLYDPMRQALRPVVGLDIDGTSGEYHDHFIKFAEGWLGKDIPRGYDGSVNLAQWCGIAKTTYRRVKLAYRQGGLKRSMPVNYYAREFTVELRKRGALVVICTTRPYLSLEAVEADTRHWLRRNGIQHDGVITGEHKYRELVRTFGRRRVISVVDDLPEMLSQANESGVTGYLVNQPYNQPPHPKPWNGLRVDDLEEAAAEIMAEIEEWEKVYR